MTDIRWMKLESSLWKLFSSFSNWQQDANELKTELIIDHIKVSIKSTEKLLSAAQELLPDTKSARSDVCLEITLQYMSHDEATILNSQPIKRKQTDNNKERPKSKAIGSSSKSKTKSKWDFFRVMVNSILTIPFAVKRCWHQICRKLKMNPPRIVVGHRVRWAESVIVALYRMMEVAMM